MGDGPVENLPPGLDAYAGYVDDSGIGVTFPAVLVKFPAARHLSIATHGARAMCADVESGAMSSWAGYDYGYCAVSDVNRLVAQFGRPKKLWTAHRDPALGAHICSPACWPGLVTTADGTQWSDHGGAWDESLLADNFFDLYPEESPVHMIELFDGRIAISAASPDGHLLIFTSPGPNVTQPGQWSCIDVTDAIGADAAGRMYTVAP